MRNAADRPPALAPIFDPGHSGLRHEGETEDKTVRESRPAPDRPKESAGRGPPDYGLRHAPGKLWRSRFDTEHNLILVNKGHRDYVFASKKQSLKLRYLCRQFAKEPS